MPRGVKEKCHSFADHEIKRTIVSKALLAIYKVIIICIHNPFYNVLVALHHLHQVLDCDLFISSVGVPDAACAPQDYLVGWVVGHTHLLKCMWGM